MQITRAEIIAVTLLIHQSLWPFARFFEFCNQAVSLMLELTITSARQWSPECCCNGRLPDGLSPRSIIGKAPRSLICLTIPQRPDFSERSLSGQTACGRHPTNRKEAGSVRRLLIWVLGLAWQVCEGDRSSNQPALRLQWRHNHDFWFSDVRYQFHSDHNYISRNALRWLLISTIFYSGFFSSEAFIKQNQSSQYRCSR